MYYRLQFRKKNVIIPSSFLPINIVMYSAECVLAQIVHSSCHPSIHPFIHSVCMCKTLCLFLWMTESLSGYIPSCVFAGVENYKLWGGSWPNPSQCCCTIRFRHYTTSWTQCVPYSQCVYILTVFHIEESLTQQRDGNFQALIYQQASIPSKCQNEPDAEVLGTETLTSELLMEKKGNTN